MRFKRDKFLFGTVLALYQLWLSYNLIFGYLWNDNPMCYHVLLWNNPHKLEMESQLHLWLELHFQATLLLVILDSWFS